MKVELNTGEGISNNGTGVVVLHDATIARKFVNLANHEKEYAVKVMGKKLHFYTSTRAPSQSLKATLEKTPYLNPDIEEEREIKLGKLDVGLHVDKVQFGVFYRNPNSPPGASRLFSNEFEMSYARKSAGLLHIEYDHKLIRIQVSSSIV